MDFVGPSVDIVNCIGPQISKYLKYHMKVGENMEILRRKLEELNHQKEDIESRLSVECQFGKITMKAVEDWKQNVQTINKEIKEIEEKVSKRKFLSRASLGKQVEKKIQEVKEVHQEGSSFTILVVDAPNRGVTFSTTTLVGESTARKNMNEIWEFLIDDELRKIGVCGMGGVGKTTIMQHVNNKLLKETDNEVIWVTVSQQLDLPKLQNDIATALHFDLSKEEDTAKRAVILLRMLERRKKYVLILDDLWKAFPLMKVGIPEPTRDNGCKLVITTRSTEVCRSMGCKVVQVNLLSKEEALILFLDTVGSGVFKAPTIKETVNLIVEQCAGLPLAIVTIAGSMKGVDDVREWRNALYELCEHIKSEGMETEVIGRLKFSYDRLKDQKVQYCFLHCALYPEDFEIPREELIEYWIEEGLIEDLGTRLAMYDRGHSFLNRLENNCLLERVWDGKYVKMHDLVRDMALSITRVSPRFMVKAGMKLDELPSEHEWRDVEKVSLMRNSIAEIPPDMSPECQTLSTLLLQQNPLKMIPESFFAKMVRLEVLDLSYTGIEDLPTSIFDLKNLTALLLEECGSLRGVPDLISKLQALKKLVLRNAGITEVPSGVAKLKDLRYLDLRARYLKGMPAGLLPQLSRLQHLTFLTNPRYRPVKVKAEEVAQLRKLERFEGNLYDVDQLNMYVNSLPAQKGPNIKYHIQVVEKYTYSFGVWYDKCVSIGGFTICGDSLVLPTNIQQLNIMECHGVRSLSDISSLKDATDFRSYHIERCEGIECVFSLSSSFSYCTTPEELYLFHLGNLRGLIEGGEAAVVSASPPPATFSHLREIRVFYCPKIKNLFWPGLLGDLQNLEEIHAGSCDQMEEIIGDDENDEEEGTDAIIRFTLPKLRELRLLDLPELKSICSIRGVMVCDSLQQITVDECAKLKRMPFSLPLLHNGQPSSLKQIKAYPKEWWESVEWDYPNAKNVLLPFCKFARYWE